MSDWHLVVVPHTHWDREWYRTHAAFRYRLVRMLDGLLELLETDPGFRHFTLDGQTIVVDDYLEVRPEARERIEALVRAGRLLVGPWFVLPDEWLVSGEALIRNLRRGLAAAEALGGAMPVGYVPDQFGHVGQLPQILQGFGLANAVLWRGVGADVESTLFAWQAPDGSELPAVWLVHGYGNGMHLPLEPQALAERLDGELRAQAERSPTRCVLIMNGSDHLVPQPGLPAALAAAAPRLSGACVEIGTLPGFIARALADAPAALPRHRGELRSGLRAPLLAACASSRLAQKRRDFENDRLLTRYLEPLAAWYARLGGDPDLGALDAVWRTALENHPHDSICGCSIDAVHDEMETRFRRVADFAGAQLARVQAGLAREIVAAPGAGHAAAIWNPHGAGAGVAEGCLELPLEAGGDAAPPPLAARDAQGRALPVDVEVERAAGCFARYELPASAAAGLLRGFPREFFGDPVCALTWAREGERRCLDVWLGETQPADFDWDAARGRALEELRALGDAPIVFRPRQLPRLRVRVPAELPGAGLRTLRLSASDERDAAAGARVRAGATSDGAWLENDAWRVDVDARGRVRLAHRATGLCAEDALRVVSEADRGDTYSFDPLAGGERVERPERVRLSLAPASAARAALHIDAEYALPEALAPDRRARSATRVSQPLRITLALWSGNARLDVGAELDHRARDHRLRLHVRAPFAAQRFAVESAFELAERPIAPPQDWFGPGRPAEWPDGATPQRRCAQLESERFVCVLANRGSSEVEALPEDGATSLALTLVRAVGWLSRDDLVRRPAHAGPPLPTPGAQCPGPQRADLALWWSPRDAAPRVRAEALRFADPPLLFAAGAASGRLRDGDRLLAWDDPCVQLAALEPRAGGVTWIRLLNASDDARSVQLGWNGGGGLVRVDLRGRPLEPGATVSAELRLELRPWQLVALEARPLAPAVSR